MTKENKKRLVSIFLKKHKEKYKNLPDYAIPIPAYSDKKANGLTKCIKDFLNLSGWQAERINSAGRYIDGKKAVTNIVGFKRTIGSGKWIPGTTTPGSADISATIFGRSVKIEVKIGRDKQSPQQVKYQQDIEKAGGVYIIAKTLDSFLEWYDKFLIKIKSHG